VILVGETRATSDRRRSASGPRSPATRVLHAAATNDWSRRCDAPRHGDPAVPGSRPRSCSSWPRGWAQSLQSNAESPNDADRRRVPGAYGHVPFGQGKVRLQGKGCATCNFHGVKGRSPRIYEVMAPFSEEIRAAILKNVSSRDLRFESPNRKAWRACGRTAS